MAFAALTLVAGVAMKPRQISLKLVLPTIHLQGIMNNRKTRYDV
jgi:hypothetical protein